MDANARPKYWSTPAGICEAVRDGDVVAIDRILAERPEFLTIDNPHNWTKTAKRHQIRGSYNRKPIVDAAFFNQPHAAAKLLEISRDSPAICKPWDNHLPFDGHFNSLSIASALHHDEIIDVVVAEVLYRLDFNPQLIDETDDEGRTVIHYAAEQGHMPLVKELISRGARVNQPMHSGKQVIHSVLSGELSDDHLAVAKQLIERGADYDLWSAVALGDFDHAEKLLANDRSLANKDHRPDISNLSEGLPLVRACATGNRDIVELLLGCGADINATLKTNDAAEFGMPIIAATYGKHYEIANLLLDRGASIHAHPNCAAPWFDMLYYASVDGGPGWLAVSELSHITEEVRSHVQPSDSGSQAVVNLYKRAVGLGAKPQIYSIVRMKDYQEVQRLLTEEPEALGTNPGSDDTVFHCLSQSAAWLGDATTMELCLTRCPELHSGEAANARISDAIRSHNRDGDFSDYRKIIESNLAYLRDNDLDVTSQPLSLLASDFLENYSYGTNPDLPSMDDLLNLAALFIEFGIPVNERDDNLGRTPLAAAVDNGHTEYVEFLLSHGATVRKGDPPESNPVQLARKHGFTRILELLGETPGKWGAVTESDSIEIESPIASSQPTVLSPLSHAVIRMGIATIDRDFHPRGEADDTHCVFIEFPEPFPADQFPSVRLILSNRNHPQLIGSATTGIQNGHQGFLLKVRNCFPKHELPESESGVIEGVSFSWLAVLPTLQPQQEQFEVRYGLIPWRDFRGRELHEYSDANNLFGDAPFDTACGPKFIFLTTTTSNVVNAAAANANARGITDLSAYQATRHDGGGRINYLVIAKRSGSLPAANEAKSNTYFRSSELWVHASRAEPVNFVQTGLPGAWRTHWMKFLRPFHERKPCVFVTSNRHGVEGHHASVIPMTWKCGRAGFQITGLTFDLIRGQSNFDCIAIGHNDVLEGEWTSANRTGLEALSPWERFIALDGCEETSYELAASGKIGVNEFGDHGGSLLLHAVYERHQRAHIALARRLFALGADPNQKHPETNLTPLHLAAALNRIEMAKLLIQRGANVNATTVPGTESKFPTPLDCERIGHRPIRKHKGETPLHLAMLQRSFDIAHMLLDAGAAPNAEDIQGDRPIDYLPDWHTYPDHKTHWRMINMRGTATKEDYFEVIDWIKTGEST